MTKEYQDFEVYQGDAVEDVEVDVQNLDNESLTSGTITWKMSRAQHTDALVTITSTDNAMEVKTESFSFKLSESDTDRPPGTYWHQAVYEQTEGDDFTLMTGEVHILERI